MGTLAGTSIESINLVVGVLLQLALAAIILFVTVWLYKFVFKPKAEKKLEVQLDRAMEILRRRYARGKISTEEFRIMRQELSVARPETEKATEHKVN